MHGLVMETGMETTMEPTRTLPRDEDPRERVVDLRQPPDSFGVFDEQPENPELPEALQGMYFSG